MDYQRFYQRFLEILAQKYPHRENSTKPIALHLGLDQKSLARRMRGETPFTVQEIVKVCSFLNISFDALMVDFDQTVHPMKIYLRNLLSDIPESFHNLLLGIKYTAQDSEGGRVFFCSNLIPNGFYTAYPFILKFIYYTWHYRRYRSERITFSDYELSSELDESLSSYAVSARNVKNSTYLFVSDFMENVSRYVLFFHQIDKLPSDFALPLCEEFSRLIDELEEVAISGFWPDTENSVEIFVTQLPIPNSMLISESKYYSAAIIYAFYINPIINIHPETFKELRLLAQTLVAQSEIITVSGEKTRVTFFKNQRESLARLSESLKG